MRRPLPIESPATFERSLDIFQKTSIESCRDDVYRPCFVSLKGWVLMGRNAAVEDSRGMVEIFINQNQEINSPRISIFIPSSRIDEVNFKGKNSFSKVLYNPNYGKNSRLLDEGIITAIRQSPDVTLPSHSGGENKRKREALPRFTDEEDSTDDDIASVSLLEPSKEGKGTRNPTEVIRNNSPVYSPISPQPCTQEYDIFLSPPKKIAKKKHINI
jgi:hypothetical protein